MPQVRERARVTAPVLPLGDSDVTSRAPVERRMGGFTPPPLSLLDAPKAERKLDERELMEGARLLEEKCREFAVEGSVVQIHPGPVVTTFEYKPEAGVKYSKITSLAEDLCLALQAESIIIDRLPGKSTVGIQVPNQIREQISLRELLESEDYQRSPSKLTLALGKTIHGEPFLADLATMPHLLIAGSTGTGKSVGLNAMLTSILYRATPDEVRLIMIDPKRLELGMYEDIPHLLTPVVVDPKQAANALRWAVHEMEERYKTLAALGVRNIEQYNRNLRHMAEEAGEKPEGEQARPLPFIVVVIDELADLMMVAGNEVEESICRLAQMARAVGIHLILATQRPSVDVITGLIKANLPARICLPRLVAHRFAHGPRRQRRRAAARQGRHAVPAAGLVALRAAPRPLHLGTGERAAGELPAQAGQAGVRRDDHRRGEAGGGARVREGRSLRRGLSHRGAERPGVNFLPAAPPADRLQPRGAPGGHDGGRRARFGEPPAARLARCSSPRTTSTRWTRRCGSGRCWSCAES